MKYLSLKSGLQIAKQIRFDIQNSTGLTASAGVAPNKFLAKIASDWNKPDGLCIVKPHQVLAFVRNLPLRKIMGVGKATEKKLLSLNIRTMEELQACSEKHLRNCFGKFGTKLYFLARGIDESPVRATRPRKSLSKERTFEKDLYIEDIQDHVPSLISEVWNELKDLKKTPKTLFVKLKTSQFKTISRQRAIQYELNDVEEVKQLTCSILSTIDLPKQTKYRLFGAGFSNFRENTELPEQVSLF